MRRSTERTLVALLLLVTGVYALAEEVTLTTYYPSPRGVYNQLRTEDETLLAQSAGGVGIGMSSTPRSKLAVFGNATIGTGFIASAGPPNGLAVQGSIGAGTTLPAAGTKLDVTGTTRTQDFNCTAVGGCIDTGEIKTDAVTGAKILDGTITNLDVDKTKVQLRVTKNCPTGIATINSNGGGTCAPAPAAGPVLHNLFPGVGISLTCGGAWNPGVSDCTIVNTGGGGGPVVTGSLSAGPGIILSVNPWNPGSGANATITAAGGVGALGQNGCSWSARKTWADNTDTLCPVGQYMAGFRHQSGGGCNVGGDRDCDEIYCCTP